MKSIIILIIVASFIAVIKEFFVRPLQKSTEQLSKKEVEREHLETISRNFIIRMMIKINWFHLVFFIASIIGGALALSSNIVVGVIYLIIAIASIAFAIKQHKKYCEDFGIVERKLTNSDKRELQQLVNTKVTDLDEKDKAFFYQYKSVEKRLGIPMTIATTIQVIISIVMWISTFR